jgi:hypothetical protein
MEYKLQEIITETDLLIGRLLVTDTADDRYKVNMHLDFLSENIKVVLDNEQLKKLYLEMIENYNFLIYKICGVDNIMDTILDKINKGDYTNYDIQWLESVSRL